MNVIHINGNTIFQVTAVLVFVCIYNVNKIFSCAKILTLPQIPHVSGQMCTHTFEILTDTPLHVT